MKYLFLLLLFSKFSFCQNIAQNEIDEFTKYKVIQVNCTKNKDWKTSDNILKGLLNNGFLSIKNIKTSETTLNILQLNTQLGFSFCTSSYKSKIIILFSDDSTLELKNTNETTCSTTVINTYHFTNEDLVTLCDKSFKKIRIYTTDGFLDFEIKDKSVEAIKNTFILYKNTINQ